MLDGRVKTLHPKIHAAILADRDNPEHMRQLAEQGIDPIDMVVVNLYPFEETVAKPDCTFDEAIEMIDIGGPCLLRAAAKNHRHVLVVSDAHGFAVVLNRLRERECIESETRRELAVWAFFETSGYDFAIHSYLIEEELSKKDGRKARWFDMGDNYPSLDAKLVTNLRYGENPHQEAGLYVEHEDITGHRTMETSLPRAALRGETALSFNNYGDAAAALELCKELTRECGTGFQPVQTGKTHLETGATPAGDATKNGPRPLDVSVFVKHANACGVGIADSPVESYRRAYVGDPNAAMGGILACSFDITPDIASTIMDTYSRWGKQTGASGFFLDVWLAPTFHEEAVQMVRTRKNWGQRVRLLSLGDMAGCPESAEAEFRSIAGGMLAQTRDLVGLNEDQWKVVTERQPTDQEMADLRLAWLICKHTKSNAVTVCKDGMLIGNGAGQMSRVMSCRIATWLAKENRHTDKLVGSVAASDGFFPFRDGPDILMDAGVKAIIQPGGSKRDRETIAACDERGAAMIFTGTRHFKH